MTVLVLATAACGSIPQRPVEFPVSRPPASASPIQRALHFLAETQAGDGEAWAGNWPHYMELRGVPLPARVADVSSGMTAFTGLALSAIRPEHAATLGLVASDLARAARLRMRTAALLGRFALPSSVEGALVYGWWPPGARAQTSLERAVASKLERWVDGPRYHGPLVPPYHPVFPRSQGFWADSDDTVLVYLALLDHAEIDGGPAPSPRIAEVLAGWRDVGDVHRVYPAWLEPNSGAFLTWFEHPKDRPIPNDVDVAVNANILGLLGRLDALDTPGASEAIDVITRAVRDGRHRSVRDVSLYYPDNYMVHALIAQAHRHGPVPGLEDAVAILAGDVERGAVCGPGDVVYWGRQDRPLATAFAVLTLVAAGRAPELVEGGVRYLLATQDPVYGNWPEACCCEGRLESGHVVVWRSTAAPTAAALLALCRARLSRARR